MKKSKFKVSVRLITYNHGSYINQAIESVLKQETNFLVELVIGDDFSTDNTRELITNYHNKKNIFINFLERPIGGNYFHERNRIGRLYNFTNTIGNCTGEYIALLDGDDYWTDPFKLQKQVNFLEKNLQYSGCFTDAIIFNQNTGEKSNYLTKNKKSIFGSEAIIKEGGGLFPTASLVFRNKISNFPNFVFDAKSGDRALSLLLSLHGSFYKFDEVTCVYRLHDGGIFTNILNEKEKRNDIAVNNIKLLENFNLYSNFVFTNAVNETISKLSKKILINSRFKLNKSNLRAYSRLNLGDWISYLKHIIIK